MGYAKTLITCLLFPVVLIFMVLTQGANAAGNQPLLNTDSNDVQKWMAELENRIPGVGKQKIPSSVPLPKSDTVASELGTIKQDGNKDVQRISVDFYKVDLHNVFRLLNKVSHKNFVVDESVSGTLTLTLQDVPWTFVLEVIKNLKGLSSIERYNTIMIYPSSKTVTWAGESAETGTLALEPSLDLNLPAPAHSETKLMIKGKKKDITPVDQVVKAQELIKQASKAEKAGNVQDAMKFYKQASDLWVDNTSLPKKIASLALGRANDELTALNYARRALKYSPRDSEAATIAAVALARMGKNQEARGYFERAMAGENMSPDSIYNYAVFCFSQGDYRETLRLILRLEKNYPLTPDILMLRARSYDRLQDNDRAAREYRALLNAGKSVPVNLRMYAQQRLKALSPVE